MPTILFTSEIPSFYLIEQIYDPLTNVNGSIIPRPGSIVLDQANNGLLQRVISVDENTLKVTYGPVQTALLAPTPILPDTEDGNVVSIIDYGNSRFYLYYDKAENPTKLNVDKKVIILGNDAELFEIVKYDQVTQQYIPISLYYDTDGVYRGTKIPLVEVPTTNLAKVPTNCHTSLNINDEEVYYMFIYDYAGTQCGSVKLYAKKALINNVLEDDLLITAFQVTSSQMDNGEFYLYPDQDPDSLVITPKVLYNNGTDRIIPIDNMICHLYGLEGFTAAYPGQRVDLMVKYFLAPTQQATGDDLVVVDDTRALVKEIPLVVKDPGTNDYVFKLLAVPRYLPTQYRYVLMFYMYSLNDNTVRNVTPYVTVNPTFDGLYMGLDQVLTLSLRVRDIFPDAVTDYVYQQPLIIKVSPYAYYERYIFRDSYGDTYGVYGVDSPILSRPVMYYDSNIEKYFIPTSKFGTAALMLEAFYYKARPIYDNSWLTEPVVPTHFTIRDAVTGSLLLSAPIPVESYEQTFALVGVDLPNHLVGLNCIVEFLRYQNNQYITLYGAPVDVYEGVSA